jgi:hypothetical protein
MENAMSGYDHQLDEPHLDDGQVKPDAAAINPDDKKPLASGFAISIAAHCVVLFLFTLVALVGVIIEEKIPQVRVATIAAPPIPVDPPHGPDPSPIEFPIDVPDDIDKPSPISELEVQLEEFQREEQNESNIPRGRSEAIADSEMGGSGVFMAIGAGDGASGIFGNRIGDGKRRALRDTCGNCKHSEDAVDRALRWFKKHQSANGQWDVVAYPNNCTDAGAKCEPGDPGAWNSKSATDVAATGYALLCFLGAGYDHRMQSKYRATVRKGIDYLLSVQAADGLWGERNYEHPVATMAIAECYAMSNDPDLKEPAQKAVKVILARQNQDKKGKDSAYASLGWDYINPTDRNDSSVSGWNVMALKSAAAAGLSVGNGLAGAKVWLKKAWEAANPNHAVLKDPYQDESSFPYTWDSATNAIVLEKGAEHHDLAPVGALCAVFLGHKSGDMMLESLCNYVMNHQFPASYPTNTYYMYYNTLAIFQAGGERWTKWNNSVRDMLVNAQRKSADCFDGSWDWQGTKFPGSNTGRVISTAYCCLSLEVYYRYVPIAVKGKK